MPRKPAQPAQPVAQLPRHAVSYQRRGSIYVVFCTCNWTTSTSRVDYADQHAREHLVTAR